MRGFSTRLRGRVPSGLDIGCGRGLMLIGAAKRLMTGKAMGIDVWHAQDQATTPMKLSRMPGWKA